RYLPRARSERSPDSVYRPFTHFLGRRSGVRRLGSAHPRRVPRRVPATASRRQGAKPVRRFSTRSILRSRVGTMLPGRLSASEEIRTREATEIRRNATGRHAEYEMIEGDTSLYARAGGFDAILDLCRRWHELCLRDPVAAHPFEHDLHPQHDERLAAYVAQALGGPALYTGGYGDESAVQRIHAGNGVHEELDEACLALFDRALTDVGITGDVAAKISTYFRAAAEAQRVYSDPDAVVPDGLSFNYAT